MPTGKPRKIRDLVLILGDQLDDRSAVLDRFDPKADSLWMAEVAEESTHVWSHKARTTLFLSAMRHFRDRQIKAGRPILYRELDERTNRQTLADELETAIEERQPERVRVVKPGDFRVQKSLESTTAKHRIPLEVLPDRHFLSTLEEFEEHASERKQLRLEFFYRELRKRTGVLMEGQEPAGGQWNFDQENRKSFGKNGPGLIPDPSGWQPDEETKVVMAAVEKRFPDHPGQLRNFDWPVTPAQASAALEDFIAHRLPSFGDHQDAMWTGRPWLYHSRLAAAMNLKLLNPRDVLRKAEEAWRTGHAPLPAVEGFIRQILGWREYVRGVYWKFMPEYLDRNALAAHRPLPKFYWTGETEMNCLRHAIGQTLEYGYAHHIQRLMVTGLFSLLLGVRPREIHEWYLAVYVDAVEWVETPNVIGMSQFADGGLMSSKPYAASGAYINRMSNYCKGCRYKPTESTGPDACPFTTLYWDFLDRNEALLSSNHRMGMQMKNLTRLAGSARAAIRKQADKIKDQLA